MKHTIMGLVALFSAGCAVNVQHEVNVNVEYYDPYVVPHEDGGETIIFHTGATEAEIRAECPWKDGYITHGCARLAPLTVRINNDGTQVVDYMCQIIALPPEPGFLQGVWDHEEAHCMGWLHEEDYDDPTYELAKFVGK